MFIFENKSVCGEWERGWKILETEKIFKLKLNQPPPTTIITTTISKFFRFFNIWFFLKFQFISFAWNISLFHYLANPHGNIIRYNSSSSFSGLLNFLIIFHFFPCSWRKKTPKFGKVNLHKINIKKFKSFFSHTFLIPSQIHSHLLSHSWCLFIFEIYLPKIPSKYLDPPPTWNLHFLGLLFLVLPNGKLNWIFNFENEKPNKNQPGRLTNNEWFKNFLLFFFLFLFARLDLILAFWLIQEFL